MSFYESSEERNDMPVLDNLGPRVLVALDFDNEAQAHDLVKRLDPSMCRLKVGKELFTRCGPQFVERLIALGFDVFLDLKFHDIPNTTAKAVKAAADMGVWMVNVHASGGRRMMEASRDIIEGCSGRRPRLIAVTVLTSIDSDDLLELGITRSPAEQVGMLASLTQSCGLDGVVCSAQEAPALRKTLGDSFQLITPGIRPRDVDANDQRRVVTPSQAISDGASFLVIGRPITQAADPIAVLKRINQEIKGQ